MRSETKCQACGIRFRPKRTAKGIYCDLRCQQRGRQKRILAKCATCGKTRGRWPSDLKRNKNSYCNIQCLTASKITTIPIEQVMELRKTKLSYKKIAAILGCGKNKIRNMILSSVDNLHCAS